jgi:hypothetical protein
MIHKVEFHFKSRLMVSLLDGEENFFRVFRVRLDKIKGDHWCKE